MRAEVRWEGGGEAQIASLEGEAIALLSTRPFAPGSRPAGTVAQGGSEIRIKTHASRKLADGTFRVEGRVLDLTRALRVTLTGLLAAARDAESSEPSGEAG